ncbi:MAG: hypothetical protein DRI80_15130 [Chloroflexota bacterium]|nr:MAG: hypothetical protein DRI80_15130 [Chloroflexota bacterium]
MSKLVGELFRSWFRGWLIYLVSAAIVVPLGCLLVFLPLGLVTRYDASIWVLIIPAALFFLILVGGGFGFLFWAIRRRAAQLDAAFTPLGLTGRREMLTMRSYHGEFRGREAHVHFRRGPTLEIYLGTPLQTRLSVDEPDRATTALAGWVNRHPLTLADPALGGLRVFALDEAWTRSLLADPRTPGLLQRLIKFEGPFLVRQVQLMPGSLVLRLHYSKRWLAFDVEVEPEQARQWFEDLAALADVAEALPPPQVTAEASALEQTLRTRRRDIWRWALIILFGALFGIPLCVALPIAIALILWGP